MKTLWLALLGSVALDSSAQTYNPLWIPPTLTGPVFNLSLNPTNKQFFPGAKTTTYGYNGADFWGPTLIMNKGDVVTINVSNNLPVDTTTVHWHGFHIPAIMDGGPHQTIPAGTVWSPMFTIMNDAATYWYHPHLHEKTQEQLSHGAGGMIIIRDPQEAALALPRTYGVDDIPLALTSRRFNTGGPNVNQIATANSAYGDYMLVNGTKDPEVKLPAQLVRLRILNAEIERSYYLGLSNNANFHVIGTDGRLLDAPITTNRVLMGVGERYELLLDLTGLSGSTLALRSFNNSASLGTQLAGSYPGGEPGTTGQFGSLLNNLDFNVLQITVTNQTPNPITAVPGTLVSNTFWTTNQVTKIRTVNITGGAPGLFYFNTTDLFSPGFFNQTVELDAIEQWTIQNTSGFSHSYHIHDVQFYLTSRVRVGGGPGAGPITNIFPCEKGWKDTLYVQRNSAVTFLAKFDHFASPNNPFMYHCHFSNHEDEGLMGQFVVQNDAGDVITLASSNRTGGNSNVTFNFTTAPGTTYAVEYSTNANGSWTSVGLATSSNGLAATFVETDATRLAQTGFYRIALSQVTIASFTRTGNNTVVNLDFKATPGTTYALQYSTDMTTGSWTNVGYVTSDGLAASFVETNAARLAVPRGFYRVTTPVVP